MVLTYLDLCSSLRGLSSTIQLRMDNSQPAKACPWKFHNVAYAADSDSFSAILTNRFLQLSSLGESGQVDGKMLYFFK